MTGRAAMLAAMAMAVMAVVLGQTSRSDAPFHLERLEAGRLDDRFQESCRKVGIHLDCSDSYIGHVLANWG
jgi:hypothetical protein